MIEQLLDNLIIEEKFNIILFYDRTIIRLSNNRRKI